MARPRTLRTPADLPSLLVPRQVAVLLGVSEDTVRAQTGKTIPGSVTDGSGGKRIYRYSKAEILALVDGRTGSVDLAAVERAAFNGTRRALAEAFGELARRLEGVA